jgi:predicted dehydrogenase
MKFLNIGIVGTGSAAKTHFEILQNIPNVGVRAVFGRDRKRLSLWHCEYSLKMYASVEEMVKKEALDIVLIANENFYHAVDARSAMEAGANVLIEKPLDASLISARNLLTFSETHQKILGVVLQKRFDPNVEKIRKVLIEKELGEILLARVDVFMHRSEEYFNSKYWIKDSQKIGGGIILHHAIHSIDALLWIMDSEVISVSGWTSNYARGMDIEDSGGCWIKFENGVVASVNASVAVHESLRNRLEIIGTSASVHLEGRMLKQLPVPSKRIPTESVEPSKSVDKNELHCLWIDYIDAVRCNRLPRSCGASTIKTEELINTIYRSSELSKTIFLNKD